MGFASAGWNDPRAGAGVTKEYLGMNGRCALGCAAAAVLWLGSGLPALGQAADEKKRESGGGGYNAVIDNIDMLVDNYARFLGRKYTLNEDQDAFTKQLLREKA